MTSVHDAQRRPARRCVGDIHAKPCSELLTRVPAPLAALAASASSSRGRRVIAFACPRRPQPVTPDRAKFSTCGCFVAFDTHLTNHPNRP